MWSRTLAYNTSNGENDEVQNSMEITDKAGKHFGGALGNVPVFYFRTYIKLALLVGPV